MVRVDHHLLLGQDVDLLVAIDDALLLHALESVSVARLLVADELNAAKGSRPDRPHSDEVAELHPPHQRGRAIVHAEAGLSVPLPGRLVQVD